MSQMTAVLGLDDRAFERGLDAAEARAARFGDRVTERLRRVTAAERNGLGGLGATFNRRLDEAFRQVELDRAERERAPDRRAAERAGVEAFVARQREEAERRTNRARIAFARENERLQQQEIGRTRTLGSATQAFGRLGAFAWRGVAAAAGSAALAVRSFADRNSRVRSEVEGVSAAFRRLNDAVASDASSSGLLGFLERSLDAATRLRDRAGEVVATLAGIGDADSAAMARRAAAQEAELERRARERDTVRGLDAEAAAIRGGVAGERSAIESRFEAMLRSIGRDETLSPQERSRQVARFAALRDEQLNALRRRVGIEEARAQVAAEALRREQRADQLEINAQAARMAGREAQADALDAQARAERERAALLRRDDLGPSGSLERRAAADRIETRLTLDSAAIRRREDEAAAAAERDRRDADAALRSETERFRIQSLRLDGREREAELAEIELERAEARRRIETDLAASEAARRDAAAAAEAFFDRRRDEVGRDREAAGPAPLVSQAVAGLARFVFGGGGDPDLAEARRQTEILRRIADNTSRGTVAVLGA